MERPHRALREAIRPWPPSPSHRCRPCARRRSGPDPGLTLGQHRQGISGSMRKLASFVVLLALGVRAAAEDTAARFDALLAEGDRLVSQQVRRSERALPLYREAIRLAQAGNDQARAARAWAELGEALGSLYRYDESAAALDRAGVLARETRQGGLEALILRRIGYNRHIQGEYEEADRDLGRAAELARRAGDRAQMIGAINTRSVNARYQGRLLEAEALAREGLRELDRMLA